MKQLPYNTLKDGVIDWFAWYHEHRDKERNFEQERRFLEDCIGGLIDLLAVAAVEIEALKGANTPSLIEIPAFRPKKIMVGSKGGK